MCLLTLAAEIQKHPWRLVVTEPGTLDAAEKKHRKYVACVYAPNQDTSSPHVAREREPRRLVFSGQELSFKYFYV